jgi:putative endonuclease
VPAAWIKRLGMVLGLTRADVASGRVEGGGSPGNMGERAAAAYLVEKGFKILGVNLKSKIGEIDILAMDPDGKTVVVVEVKTREEAPSTPARYDPTRPEERVGFAKQRKLGLLAAWAVKRYRLHNHPVRFDVVGVDLKPDGNHEVRHYVGAFEARW